MSARLIAAFADNLTDALSIHIFQESEALDEKGDFAGTLASVVARFLLCLSFVALVGMFPLTHAAQVAIALGMLLPAALTYLVARERKVGPLPVVVKLLAIASAVIIARWAIGRGIGAVLACRQDMVPSPHIAEAQAGRLQ